MMYPRRSHVENRCYENLDKQLRDVFDLINIKLSETSEKLSERLSEKLSNLEKEVRGVRAALYPHFDGDCD